MHHLAFFVISTQLGGAEQSLLDYLRNTNRDKNRLIVITPKRSGPLIEEIHKLNIKTQTIPLPNFILSISRNKKLLSCLLFVPTFFYLPIYLLKISHFLNQQKISKAHSTGLKFHILLGFISLCHKRVHFYIHLRDILNASWITTYFRWLAQKSNIHFIFNSQATADALSDIEGPVIYNGFDTKYWSPTPSKLKQELNINSQTLLIGIVAVIARWKGQREFLHMAHKLSQQNPSLHFAVIGDEIYDTLGEKGELDKLKKLQSDLKLENLHFINFQKDIKNIYCGLDLLVHGSIKPEPFGRVLVEALLCGCPILAANQGGPLEIFKPGEGGLFYEMGNIKSLTLNAEKIITNPQFHQELRDKAREQGLKFNMNTYVQKLDHSLLTE